MLYRLSSMGKLNVSRGCIKDSKNVLDLGMESFSVGCRKNSSKYKSLQYKYRAGLFHAKLCFAKI